MLGTMFQLGQQLANFMHDEEMQDDAQTWGTDQLGYQQRFNAEQAAVQRDWEKSQADTVFSRAVTDLKRAGLNPMMAYTNAAAPTGHGASAAGASAGASGIASSAGHLDVNGIYSAAQVDLIQAEADKERAMAENLRGQTGLQPFQRDKLKAEVDHISENIRLMVVQGAREGASAEWYQQQTQNLRAMVPHIQASIEQMRSMIKLNDAQIAQLAAQSKLSIAQTKEIIQRVESNLPAAEKAWIALKTQLGSTDLNQRTARSTIYQGLRGEFLELVRSIKDAINPLNGLFGGGSVTTYGN